MPSMPVSGIPDLRADTRFSFASGAGLLRVDSRSSLGDDRGEVCGEVGTRRKRRISTARNESLPMMTLDRTTTSTTPGREARCSDRRSKLARAFLGSLGESIPPIACAMHVSVGRSLSKQARYPPGALEDDAALVVKDTQLRLTSPRGRLHALSFLEIERVDACTASAHSYLPEKVALHGDDHNTDAPGWSNGMLYRSVSF